MKIDFIKINGFGKLKNKFVKFDDGINIVYGENETGKSTIVKFITSILYKVSKSRSTKIVNDYDRYLPWDNSEYSGKITYTIGNEDFEVFKDYRKKNPIIYNRKGEDISKQFPTNKSKEIEYFESQTNIDEDTFLSTAVMEQKNVELDDSSTRNIIQKISNLVTTGSDNISYQKSMNKIEKLQTENIGTEKTKNRPINIIEDNIYKLSEEKKMLINYKEKVADNLNEEEKISKELDVFQTKKDILKAIKRFQDKNKKKEIELEYDRKSEEECLSRAEKLREKVSNLKQDEKTSKPVNTMNIVLLVIFAFALIEMIIFNNNKLYACIPAVLIIIDIIFMIKLKSKSKMTEKVEENKVQTEYENSAKEYIDKKKANDEKEEEINREKQSDLDEIYCTFNNEYFKEFINSNIENTDFDNLIDEFDLKIKNLSIQLNMIENEKKDIDNKLERLAVIEEELKKFDEEKEKLKLLNISFDIAKECLESAYEEIKKNLSPKFEKKLCDISGELTNGKYNNIVFNEENGLLVEVENGTYMPVDRLSIGTIDQMYIALRLSILNELSTENIPIIFDDTFVYFDDNRLENILLFIKNSYPDKQIIILTCSRREEVILRKNNLEYNLIELEK